MVVIGLIGGIASGKSLVASQLQQRGAEVLDGDRAGHDVLRNVEVIETLRREFGEQVVAADGTIDRGAVAKIVFEPTEAGQRQLKRLEQITHPRIGDLLQQQLSQIAARDPNAVVVVDAALMLEAGWGRYCDKIVFVDASREQRLARASTRGWDESQFASREAAQIGIEKKRARADFIIDNSGDPEHTKQQVEKLWTLRLSAPVDNQNGSE